MAFTYDELIDLGFSDGMAYWLSSAQGLPKGISEDQVGFYYADLDNSGLPELVLIKVTVKSIAQIKSE